MPAYVSHTIMAREVFNKIKNNKADLNYMLTFSLGGDLSKYSRCRRDSHRIKQDEFIYNIADYMIDNNLTTDSECLGFLYGHICHYIMDSVVHPLVRKVDKTCKPRNNNHTLIEGYYDSYLSNNKCDRRIDKYDNREILKSKINKKISKMIDYVYLKTYDTKNLSMYYRFNIFLYKKIKYLYKFLSLKTLKKLSGFDEFMRDNKNIDLFNNNGSIKYKDYKGKVTNDSLDEVYKKSVTLAVKYINDVNKYINNKIA